MEALFIHNAYSGHELQWSEEIPDPNFTCPEHLSAWFEFTDFTEYARADESGEDYYGRVYTCIDCDNDDDWDDGDDWPDTNLSIESDYSYHFYLYDCDEELFYLKPTHEQVARRESEIAEAAGQLRLPMI
jgi:hypothetical protein